MIAIIYFSHAQIHFDEAALNKVTEFAAAKNKRLGVTGYLSFRKNSFVQYLECQNESVLELMETIEKDDRHKVMHQIVKHDLTEQKFPSWHMKHLNGVGHPEISLESVLEDQLSIIKKFDIKGGVWEEKVWRTVDHLARLRPQIA